MIKDKELENYFSNLTQQSIARLGRIISIKRKNLKWTLDETARATGISKSLISALENSRAKSAPSMLVLTKLIHILDISPNDLMSCFYWKEL